MAVDTGKKFLRAILRKLGSLSRHCSEAPPLVSAPAVNTSNQERNDTDGEGRSAKGETAIGKIPVTAQLKPCTIIYHAIPRPKALSQVASPPPGWTWIESKKPPGRYQLRLTPQIAADQRRKRIPVFNELAGRHADWPAQISRRHRRPGSHKETLVSGQIRRIGKRRREATRKQQTRDSGQAEQS